MGGKKKKNPVLQVLANTQTILIWILDLFVFGKIYLLPWVLKDSNTWWSSNV